MRRLTTLLAAVALIASVLLGIAGPVGAGGLTVVPLSGDYRPGVVLVGYWPGTSPATMAALDSLSASGRADVIGSGTHVLAVTAGREAATISGLLADPAVRYAEPDYRISLTATPNDPSFPLLWGLQNTGQAGGIPGADIGATAAWNTTTGSSSIVVGVVDTGIDYTHPDLAANVWSNPGGIGGCGAGTHGFNAIGVGSCNPMDDNSHGTHVSGTIGAVGNNGLGVTGVNWNVKLMGLKFLSAGGGGYTSDAIEAIAFAVTAKQSGVNVRVLNASWGGGGYSQGLKDEIDFAGQNDILFVAAAGNSGADLGRTAAYPCSYSSSNLVCVAATTSADGMAYFSNFGATSVDLGAPGVSILSTVLSGAYQYYSGTSMATPHVAGAAALILASGNRSVSALRSAVLAAVDVIPSLVGRTATGGRLDVSKAISGGAPTPPGIPTLTATAGVGSVGLSWTVPSAGSSPINGYRVYRSTTSGAETFLAALGTTTTYNDTAVVGGTPYYYRVSATSAAGEGSQSNEATATPTAPTPPGIPTLTATAGVGSVGLSWTVPSAGSSPINGYRVYRSTTSGAETFLAALGTTTTYNDTAVVGGTPYYYRVSATSAAGEGSQSNEATATPTAPVATPPGAPRNLVATADRRTGVTLTWLPPTSAGSSPITGYWVWRSTTPGGEAHLIQLGNVTSYSDRPGGGAVYYYVVTATSAAGEGPKSNEASVRPV